MFIMRKGRSCPGSTKKELCAMREPWGAGACGQGLSLVFVVRQCNDGVRVAVLAKDWLLGLPGVLQVYKCELHPSRMPSGRKQYR